ncbi:uncharacterized protein LOC121386338 isoform X2 [Gigantopelta aegis]|uniref:uncharacterized protein LOC121386338 isoform X2 n=1 Tax=Gigantopelta aegis TaxID=1735272 RepID=UPI001B887EB7|nr:uncharacterized protein LOC121386338 isoform X2 [Gigantopelta aegis]
MFRLASMMLLKLYATLAVTVVIFSTNHTTANKDVKLALSGSAPYGSLSQCFVFTCTVSGATAVDNYSVYLRNSVFSKYKYHRIWQIGDNCSQSPTPMPNWIRKGYYSVCGFGTKELKSDVREYKFIIKDVSSTDRTDWWCQLHWDERYSNKINLIVNSLEMSLRMKMFSAPVLDKPLTLICEMRNAAGLNATVQFIKGTVNKSLSVVGTLRQEYSNCSQIGDTTRGYNPKCGIATDQANSNIKLYTMEIALVSSHDNTMWICLIRNPCTGKKRSALRFHLTLWHDLTASLSMRPHQPVYKKMFILTCKLTNAAVIKATIQFRKKTSAALNLIGTLYQNYDKCKISKDTFRGYTAKCGKGTDSGPSDTKVYVIEIAKLSLRDNGVWSCYVQDEESSKSVTSRSFKICSSHCDHGILLQDSCTCDCDKHWIGEECEICRLHCDNDASIQYDTCTCNCGKNWSGDKCEICNIQCTHGRVQNDTCTCDCGENRTGENCSTEIKKSDRSGRASVKVPDSKGVNGNLLGGIIAAVAMTVLLVAVASAWIYHKKRSQNQENLDQDHQKSIFDGSFQSGIHNPAFSSEVK